MESHNTLNTENIHSSYPGTNLDLREFIFILWGGKWVIGGLTLLASIASLVIALNLPDVYRAEALLAPASSEESGGLGGLASQYGGLASLAGVNLGGLSGGADKTALGIEVLRSRKFLGQFIKRHNLLIPLMAAKNWELSTKKLILDTDIYDENKKIWVRVVSLPKQAEPSILEASEMLSSIMVVVQDSDTGFVKIIVEHYSPYIAKQWVDWIVEDINREIRDQDATEARNSIAYLKAQLELTSLAELQAIFYELIEEQTKTIMLANARSEYLFRTVDPAVVSEEKYGPNRMNYLLLGVFLGFFSGVFVVLIKNLLASEK